MVFFEPYWVVVATSIKSVLEVEMLKLLPLKKQKKKFNSCNIVIAYFNEWRGL